MAGVGRSERARRNFRASRLLAIAALVGILLAGATPAATSATSAQPGQELEPEQSGRELYLQFCASCHGPRAEGSGRSPSLIGVGTAALDFQLSTGRMPMADDEVQAKRKPSPLTAEQMRAIIDYVASLAPGQGPAIPEVDVADGDVSLGQDLFVNNCAPCHGVTATGAVAGDDDVAPGLFESEPVTIAEAMAIGPGEMPRFPFTSEEVNSIVAYLAYLQSNPSPGGFDLGGVGPVPEGFIAWAVGMTLLLILIFFIGRHRRASSQSRE